MKITRKASDAAENLQL